MSRFVWVRAGLALLVALLVGACAGTPVKFDSSATSAPKDRSDAGIVVNAEACGFQLLLFIPIAVNSRLERAYSALKRHAAGAPVVDIEVEERWGYAVFGTTYCTTVRGRVLTPGSS